MRSLFHLFSLQGLGALCLVVCLIPVNAAAITVKDETGVRLTFDKPVERIVALAPHIVENVYSAGAGDKLVGVVSYSNYPEAATTLPLVGSYKLINLERLIELEPDVVLAWSSGNGDAIIKRLRDLGIPVFVDDPKTVNGVAQVIRTIGSMAGTQQTANAVADDFEQHMMTLKAEYALAEKVSVFYQVWNSPLQTLNGNHVISHVLALCGGVNVFANADTLAPTIGREALLLQDPQVIIASGMGEARPEWLDDWYAWPSLQAVQGEQLYFVPPDHIQRHTVRLSQGADTICHALDQARQYYTRLND